MITARFSGEQGRTVMAVPGRIDQASSRGCHQLIREGAVMVTSVDDILEELNYMRLEPTSKDEREASDLPTSQQFSDLEKSILSFFAGGETVSADTLSEGLKRPVAEIASVLMGLELKRQIIKRADGLFEMRKA